MNPRIEKLKAERDKTAQKIEVLTARLKSLNEQILKLENTDIIGIVRDNGLTIDQLAELMTLLDTNPTASVPDYFEERSDQKDENE